MNYPAEVQEYIDILNEYTEVESMSKFNILHMYPTEIAHPNGHYDSMFFDLWLFNTETMEKCFVGRHDSLRVNSRVYSEANVVDIVRIFADGSTMIKFAHLVSVPRTNFQEYCLT